MPPSHFLSGRDPHREQRTTKDLVAGTSRWKRRLDFIISKLALRTPSELDPEVLAILRIALFEVGLAS